MPVVAIDHVALPSADPEAMLRFYGALGFGVPSVEEWRRAGIPFFSVQVGAANKINVHGPALWQSGAFTLRGRSARPGCGDLCFVWSGTVAELERALAMAGAEVEEGPVARTGGRGSGRAEGTSVYTRDPDGNLIEFIVYAD